MIRDFHKELLSIRNLLKLNSVGMSVTEIAKALRKNKNTVGRYLDILLISGQVDMRAYGKAKIFTLSQRVPLSAMLSYSKDLIMVLDKDSRIVNINEPFLALLDLTRKEAIGSNIANLKSSEVNLYELAGALTTPTADEADRFIIIRSHETGELTFRLKSIPTVFNEGAKGLTIILSDATEKIRREKEIREWEERFRMMAENIQDAVLIIENERVVYANHRITGISGYTFKELRLTNAQVLITPETRLMMSELYRKSSTCMESPAKFQFWISCKNGEKRCLYGQINSVRNGDIVSTCITMNDMTEFVEREQALMDRVIELERKIEQEV